MTEILPTVKPLTPAALAAWRKLGSAVDGTEPCCTTDPGLWVSDAAADRTKAIILRGRCHALSECRAYASVAGERHLVWGGRDRSSRSAR